VPSYPERDEAEFLTASAPGMRNDIRLIPIPGKRHMKETSSMRSGETPGCA